MAQLAHPNQNEALSVDARQDAFSQREAPNIFELEIMIQL